MQTDLLTVTLSLAFVLGCPRGQNFSPCVIFAYLKQHLLPAMNTRSSHIQQVQQRREPEERSQHVFE